MFGNFFINFGAKLWNTFLLYNLKLSEKTVKIVYMNIFKDKNRLFLLKFALFAASISVFGADL
ncbi:hypothetical protein B5F34_11135 [Mediterranea sp. An20]|nr:hypothetical protein B5F34_11135 [Mediterranea sp. An20]